MTNIAVHEVPIDDPESWTEVALRAWEAEINTEGWGRSPRFGLLMRLPGGGGLGLAHIAIDEPFISHPDMMFSVLAGKPVKYLMEFCGSRWWAGLTPVAGVLCDEAWGLPASQLNMSLFRADPGGLVKDQPARVEVRRVLLVAPKEENDAILLRRKGSLAPELSQGIPPEGVRAEGGKLVHDHSLRDNIREVVRKLVPPELR